MQKNINITDMKEMKCECCIDRKTINFSDHWPYLTVRGVSGTSTVMVFASVAKTSKIPTSVSNRRNRRCISMEYCKADCKFETSQLNITVYGFRLSDKFSVQWVVGLELKL